MNQKIKTQNRLLSLLLALVLVVSMIPISGLTATAASTGAYDGTPVTPTKITSENYTAFGLTESNWGGYNGWYGIRTAAELYGFAKLVKGGECYANAVLLQDVALNTGTVTENGSSSGQTYEWSSIGDDGNPFKGNFDGNGCTISGVWIRGDRGVGLFGVIGEPRKNASVTIKNIVLKNSYIEGTQYVGGIVGCTNGYGASISNCKICEDVAVVKNSDGIQPNSGGIIGGYHNLSTAITSKYRVTCSVTNCVNLGVVKNKLIDFKKVLEDSFNYFGAITGMYAEQDNAFEFVPVSNCYYLSGHLLDENDNALDKKGNTFNYGKGGTSNRISNTGCIVLSSTSDSHTCVSVTHKEIKATHDYPGCSEYSYCLICGKVTSGTKTEYSASNDAHSLSNKITCLTGATCLTCGKPFEKDPNAHTSTEFVYECVDSNVHNKLYACCRAKVNTENHTFLTNEKESCKYCGSVVSKPTIVTEENRKNFGLDSGYVGYYAIQTVPQLYWFASLTNGTLADGTSQNQSANAVLIKDIDMSEATGYVPIGTTGLYYSADGEDKGYSGTFDGNAHVIKNLTFTGSSSAELTYGIFGTLSGTVKNLGVENMNFTRGNSDCRAGGIVGQIITGSSVTTCYVANTTIDANGKVAGGIAGCNYAGTITNCHTYKVTVMASRPGGIVGDNRGDGGDTDRLGTVSDCYTTASYIQNNQRTGNVSNCTTGISDTDFSSGKITWLLNGKSVNGVWKQTLNANAYPNFSGQTVYVVPTDCGGKNGTQFKNSPKTAVAHVYDNGLCHGTVDEVHYEPAEFDADNNAYKIANLGNLLWFGDQVNSGNTKINAILTANINCKDDVAKIIGIGTNDKPYEGVFDGNNKTLDIQIVSTDQYAAPFAYVNGATIKNLTVTGSITSSQKFAASIVARVNGGTVTLEKCISEVTITSTASGDGTNGGLVANVGSGELKINNCAFVGAYVTSTATSSGGFVGWTNKNAKTYITNSFIAADFSNAKRDGCNTFSRNPNYVTVENCYYLTALGDVPNGATQKNAKKFASGEVAWLLNGRVDNGTWKQTFYTDKTPNFSGGAVYQTIGNCDSYTNNEAEKNRNHAVDENGFCKYCGKAMNLIPAVWNESKRVYEISNAKQLMWFAELVNGTLGDTKQNQSANAVLMNDIDMSEITDYVPIGGTTGLYYSADGDDKGYKGIFDGNGYVIKNLSVNGSDTKELTYGVFGTLSGTVKHLGVENFTFILGLQDCRAGGIAGQMLSGGLIEDCYVANSVINAKGKVAGGIAGCNYAGKITNCHTYKVTVTATRIGGIVGDNRGDGGTNDRKGSVINCYTDAGNIENSDRAGTVTNSTANISESDFASGRICSLLGGNREVWKQTIGSQDYPTFSGDTVKIDGYNVTGTVISAKITWTTMEFTYTAGDWDPSTDSYGAGIWTVAEGGGKITVENLGNIRLYTKFTYTSNIGGVTGKFDIGNTAVESRKSVTSQLTLEDKPDSWNAMLGTVEVRISRYPIDCSWNVGDTVTWCGDDGKIYTCTVVSKSNSGYVLITSKQVKQVAGDSFDNFEVMKEWAQAVGGRLPCTNVNAETKFLETKIGTSTTHIIPVYNSKKKNKYSAYKYKDGAYGHYNRNVNSIYSIYYAFDIPIS